MVKNTAYATNSRPLLDALAEAGGRRFLGYIRSAVGLEDIEDIADDLRQASEKAGN